MDEKEEQELIEKGLRYRPKVTEARTYIVNENGNEIDQLPLIPFPLAGEGEGEGEKEVI